jgi:sterol desaturase/sphingolipid hydroxylase (fatty acid hydroxylase superfamily)
MVWGLLHQIARWGWVVVGPLGSALAIYSSAVLASLAYQHHRTRKPISLGDLLAAYFPPATRRSMSALADVKMYVCCRMVGPFMAIGEALLTVTIATGIAAALKAATHAHQIHGPGPVAFGVIVLGLLLTRDFSNYLTHLMMHKVGFLWELHKVHHSASAMSPLTSTRIHPLEDKFVHVVAALLISAPAGVAMTFFAVTGKEMVALTWSAHVIGSLLVLEPLKHSQFPVSFGPLERVLLSPRMHHVHHSAKEAHWDRNLGYKLSIWDWMFGTALIAPKSEVLTYGIGRGCEYDRQYESLLGAYVLPVIGLMKRMLGKQAAHMPAPAFPKPAQGIAVEAGLDQPAGGLSAQGLEGRALLDGEQGLGVAAPEGRLRTRRAWNDASRQGFLSTTSGHRPWTSPS